MKRAYLIVFFMLFAMTVVYAATGDPVLEGNVPASVLSSGTVAHERGGLEADVSAYDGFPRIGSGATTQEKMAQTAFFFNLLAAATSSYATQYDLTYGAGNLTGEGSPSVPRNMDLHVTDGDSSISALSILVEGLNALGESDSETVTGATGGETIKAFATITNISVVSVTGANAGDVLDVGVGNKIGLCYDIKNTADVFKVTTDGADSTAARTVDTVANTVTFGTAPDGAHDYQVWFKLE